MLSLLKPYFLSILSYGAMALGVLAVLFGARQSGKHAERVDNLRKALDNARIRRDIEIRNSVDDTDIRERMRKKRNGFRSRV